MARHRSETMMYGVTLNVHVSLVSQKSIFMLQTLPSEKLWYQDVTWGLNLSHLIIFNIKHNHTIDLNSQLKHIYYVLLHLSKCILACRHSFKLNGELRYFQKHVSAEMSDGYAGSCQVFHSYLTSHIRHLRNYIHNRRYSYIQNRHNINLSFMQMCVCLWQHGVGIQSFRHKLVTLSNDVNDNLHKMDNITTYFNSDWLLQKQNI